MAPARRLVPDSAARLRLGEVGGPQALITLVPVAHHDIDQGLACLFPCRLEELHKERGSVFARVVLNDPTIGRDLTLPLESVGADPLNSRRLALKSVDERVFELVLRVDGLLGLGRRRLYGRGRLAGCGKWCRRCRAS